MNTKELCGWLVLVGACLAQVPPVSAQPEPEVQKNIELYQLDRKYAGNFRSYADGRFNLDAMPAYQPRQRLSGWIKLHGAATLEQGRLARLWEEGFRKFHPDAHFSFYLPAAEVALTPLYYRQADITLVHDRSIWPATRRRSKSSSTGGIR
jgi:hypothetical protein